MDNTIPSQPNLNPEADYEAAIELCFTEMGRLREQMHRDQADIERLKMETRAMLAEMKAA